MRIKQLRVSTKSKPEKLAEMLHISLQAYYKYENEVNEPNIDNLKILANYYNVSIDYLVGRDNDKNATTNYGEKKELLKISEQLNDKNMAKLLVYATALLDGQK